jgi:carbohydrate-selective porin OprB
VTKRRSLYFHSLIPHFSVFIGKGDSIYQVEYVPPVEDGDVGVNYVALFDGYFQVKVWQKTGSGRSKTLLGAWRTAKRQAAVAHSRPQHETNRA